MYLLYAQRNLATPSSRFLGHWMDKNMTSHYFDITDSESKMGSYFTININRDTLEHLYQILQETLSENKLALMMQLADEPLRLDECTISKDGLLLIRKMYIGRDLEEKGTDTLQYVDSIINPFTKQSSMDIKEVEHIEIFEPLNLKAIVEITDWTNRPTSSGNYHYVEGIVKNTGNMIAQFTKVTVKALDGNNKLVAIEQGYTDPCDLSPGEEGIFKIMIERIPRIEKFSVKVNWD
jgi:hypothetical protein